jgi:hypothetical protein
LVKDSSLLYKYYFFATIQPLQKGQAYIPTPTDNYLKYKTPPIPSLWIGYLSRDLVGAM